MTDPCPAEFIALGERLADATGEILRRYFRRPLEFDDKLIQNGKKFFNTLANPLLRRDSSTMQNLTREYAGTFYLYYASGGR